MTGRDEKLQTQPLIWPLLGGCTIIAHFSHLGDLGFGQVQRKPDWSNQISEMIDHFDAFLLEIRIARVMHQNDLTISII